MSTDTTVEEREAYCAGLEQLAAILRAHPDLPLPYSGSEHSEIQWILVEEPAAQREFARIFCRAVPGVIHKNVRGTAFDLIGRIGGLHLQAILHRDAVCERVVTGSETVTREVPDPVALAAVPRTTVTETVETVEWRCAPLLADAPERGAA